MLSIGYILFLAILGLHGLNLLESYRDKELATDTVRVGGCEILVRF